MQKLEKAQMASKSGGGGIMFWPTTDFKVGAGPVA